MPKKIAHDFDEVPSPAQKIAESLAGYTSKFLLAIVM